MYFSVGADDHIGPTRPACSKRADVVIGPYDQSIINTHISERGI